ncbi:MAG: prepilin-type N-terminal cleavage/methylation domain-containing protein [Patescibacteria group bacterium]
MQKSHVCRQLGFTLIELLVVISIMTLLIGSGIASYLKFNERQILLRDVETVQYLLEAARVGVQTGDLSHEDCASLEGYQLEANAGASTITLSVLCKDELGVSQKFPLNNEILDSDTSFTSAVNMIFRPLSKGVEGAGKIELLSRDVYQYTIEVSSGGAINTGELQAADI